MSTPPESDNPRPAAPTAEARHLRTEKTRETAAHFSAQLTRLAQLIELTDCEALHRRITLEQAAAFLERISIITDQSEGRVPPARPESSQATCDDSGVTRPRESDRDDQGDGVVPSPSPGVIQVVLTEPMRAWLQRSLDTMRMHLFRIPVGDDEDDLPTYGIRHIQGPLGVWCASCNEDATTTILRHGQAVPVCWRHYNHWRSPTVDALASRWEALRDGVLSPGLRKAAEDLRAADAGQFERTVERRGREALAKAWDEGFNSDYEGDGWPPNPYRGEEQP